MFNQSDEEAIDSLLFDLRYQLLGITNILDIRDFMTLNAVHKAKEIEEKIKTFIINHDQVFDETVDIYSKVIEDIGLKVVQIEFTDNYVDQIVTPDKVRRQITQELVDAKS